MRNRLFVFGRFFHDSQRVLAGVSQLALVTIKSGVDRMFRCAFELRIATFAHAHHWRSLFHDSQAAFWHESSLAQSLGAEERL